MKTFKDLREGYASAAQRKAVWAARNDAKKEDTASVKEKTAHVFDNEKDARAKAKEIGGKYVRGKGVSAGKHAAVKEDTAVDEASCGYSSKKKTNEVSKDMMGRYLKKAPASAADGGRDSVMGSGKEKQGVKKVVNRITGTQTAVDKMTGKAKVPATEKEANEPSQAVKAFLAKGGKIKKLPPAKAQGYHGKDDPGKDVHGVMSKPDTKQIGTRKKVKSMEATQVDKEVK